MKPKRNGGRPDRNGVSSKDRSLEPFREGPDETALTTDQGARVHHTDDSLKAGRRGPTLLEDFHLREKITRFDHERIPERVVHARGSAAHGFFQVYESMAKLTRAGFLQDPRTRTPVPSPALSMTTTVKDTIKGRVIAALVAPGVAGRELTAARKALEAAGTLAARLLEHNLTVSLESVTLRGQEHPVVRVQVGPYPDEAAATAAQQNLRAIGYQAAVAGR